MSIGTRSVLFGAHQFILHPLVLAWAWWRLHGFQPVYVGLQETTRHWLEQNDGNRFAYYRGRRLYASILSPRLWLAFLVHDLGYFGKPNMDGPEGERHPETGAAIMRFVCGEPWGEFVLYHSRFLAKQRGAQPSALCIADKLAIILPPRWLYLLLVNLSGEIGEYMARSDRNNATGAKYAIMHPTVTDQHSWYADMQRYVSGWIEEHKDGREDTWTPATSP